MLTVMRQLVLAVAVTLTLPLRAQFEETVNVERILVDVRVTDRNGDPIADLVSRDFSVMVGGKKAEVLSAEWIVDHPSVDDESERPLDDGRLIVILVQTDFTRHPTRTRGQLNFLRYAEKMVEQLDPSDRVAVFQFDSHLRFRLDFTRDKREVREALRRTIYIEKLAAPPAVPSPSLASHLRRDEMEKATSSETGLRLIANALRPISGMKTLLLLGWGLGQRNATGVYMKRDYSAARAALEAARTSIFALDTTYADYHDLQVGLSKAARDTGGFYAKTHLFPQLAVDRLQRALIGHYELEVRRPGDLRRGTHELDVRAARRGADVLAPSTYMDRK
jgi:VWFA-related protein